MRRHHIPHSWECAILEIAIFHRNYFSHPHDMYKKEKKKKKKTEKKKNEKKEIKTKRKMEKRIKERSKNLTLYAYVHYITVYTVAA